MAAENKAIQDKLEREANALKEKMSEENEKRSMESKALQEKLEKEKAALAAQMESGSKELAEKMAMEEEKRKQEAAAMKSKIEEEKKNQGNAITEMFDRYSNKDRCCVIEWKMNKIGVTDISIIELTVLKGAIP